MSGLERFLQAGQAAQRAVDELGAGWPMVRWTVDATGDELAHADLWSIGRVREALSRDARWLESGRVGFPGTIERLVCGVLLIRGGLSYEAQYELRAPGAGTPERTAVDALNAAAYGDWSEAK